MSVILIDFIGPEHSGTMSVTGVRSPTSTNDAAPKGYVDRIVAEHDLPPAHGTVSGYIRGTANTLGGDFVFQGDVDISGSSNTFAVGSGVQSTFAGATTFAGANVVFDTAATLTVNGASTFAGDMVIAPFMAETSSLTQGPHWWSMAQARLPETWLSRGTSICAQPLSSRLNLLL